MKRRTTERRSERGATLVMVALMVFMLLGMGALSIDYGMVKTAKAEAQRAADAGALAGASVFLELAKTDLSVGSVATARAKEFAAKNTIRQVAVDPDEEVVVEPTPAEEKVKVTVTRAGITTWFAQLFGIANVGISATATARAAPAGQTPCVKPFALPDLWDEHQRTTVGSGSNKVTGDSKAPVGDHIWAPDETWTFNPTGTNPDGTPADVYAPYDPETEGSTTQTGYGSTFRDPTGCTGSSCTRDRGRPLTIAAQSPKAALGPGFFYLLRLQDAQGGKDLKENIKGCSPGVFSTDSTYDIEPGETGGPVKDGIKYLMDQDPGAHWDPSAGGGIGAVAGTNPSYGDWRGSPRVIKVGVFDPHQISSVSVDGKSKVSCGGNCELQFNNIALLFLEGLSPSGDIVQARFLYYVSGTGDPGEEGAGGSLVKKLVLVK
jgi:Flp pilus assembly protein TadG